MKKKPDPGNYVATLTDDRDTWRRDALRLEREKWQLLRHAATKSGKTAQIARKLLGISKKQGPGKIDHSRALDLYVKLTTPAAGVVQVGHIEPYSPLVDEMLGCLESGATSFVPKTRTPYWSVPMDLPAAIEAVRTVYPYRSFNSARDLLRRRAKAKKLVVAFPPPQA